MRSQEGSLQRLAQRWLRAYATTDHQNIPQHFPLQHALEAVKISASGRIEASNHQVVVIESIITRSGAVGIVKDVIGPSAQNRAVEVAIKVLPREHNISVLVDRVRVRMRRPG